MLVSVFTLFFLTQICIVLFCCWFRGKANVSSQLFDFRWYCRNITLNVFVHKLNGHKAKYSSSSWLAQLFCFFLYETSQTKEFVITISCVAVVLVKVHYWEKRKLRLEYEYTKELWWPISCIIAQLSMKYEKQWISLTVCWLWGIFSLAHDDVMACKRSPHYLPIVKGIHRRLLDSLTKTSHKELCYFLC